MGMFATIKGYDKCPVCGDRAGWQSKGLWLTYKTMDIWIGDYHDIELDENMHGEITAYGLACRHVTKYKIVKGELIKE